MLDLAALELEPLDPDVPGPRDPDGLLMTYKDARDVARYLTRYPYEERRKRHADNVRMVRALMGSQMRSDKEAEPKTSKPGAKRFSTDYAVAYGRAQGWKLLDRERFDVRTNRHHDLMLGADASFETPDGIVLIQGAGRHERAPHRRRFDERGGEERASRLKIRFLYVEFERGNKTPVVLEWWVS